MKVIMLMTFLSSMTLQAQNFTKITNDPFTMDGGNSHGIAFGDYNNDGYPDIYVSNLNEKDFLYKNIGNGSFARVKNNIVVDSEYNTASANWVDFDNDGDKDLFLAVGSTHEPENNVLYINSGNDKFKLAIESKVGDLINYKGSTESVTWGDLDNDGDLDMFEVNWKVQPNLLYINQGNGTFKQDSISGITNNLDWAITANWIDFNKDNQLDLFVARQGYPISAGNNNNIQLSSDNSLYIGTQEEQLNNAFNQYDPLVSSGGNSITSSWGDINNDGYLDVFIGNFDNQGNFLFLNQEGKGFERVYNDPVVNDKAFSIGSSFGDLDNDGDLDLFVSNGYQEPEKNFLYLNNGDGSFTKVNSGIITQEKTINVANVLEDFDNDGDLDVFVVSRDGNNNLMYRNEINSSNNWLKIKCVGVQSNKGALGVKIKISYRENSKDKIQYRELHQLSGYGAHGESIIHFGLGKQKVVDKIEIIWPSGVTQEFKSVKVNKFYQLMENDKQLNIFKL
ncbi:CRTAC1 family protein [uncultured Psychroserpens sp.]|uniref:CRTAC1 family protein n=1 Tax=uncultured Psychroserpens sp. TaxID=255436 RepID=UPI0026354295|nr:CRTAC1 family protein [uncultured Psychroserpens sp.]